jgi:hypothetical protein
VLCRKIGGEALPTKKINEGMRKCQGEKESNEGKKNEEERRKM